jgi:hypothetical protein
MKLRIFVHAAIAAFSFGVAAIGAQADSHESSPQPGILDTYACNFNDGKDMDDLMSARDYYVDQYEKNGLTAPTAYVWSLFKGEAPAELIWFDVHESLQAFAQSADAAMAATGLEKVQERFDAVITCQSSNVGAFVPVYEREGGGEGPVFVSSNACNMKHGVRDEHVADLQRHISGVLGGMDGMTPQAVYMGSPISRGPNSPDRYLFAVNDSVSAWADFVAGLGSSAAGAQLGRHFDMVFDCSTTMWTAQQVVSNEE